jgi:hypothetical protein
VIISVYGINWVDFITETECVYYAVRTKHYNVIQILIVFRRILHITAHQTLSCHYEAQTIFKIQETYCPNVQRGVSIRSTFSQLSSKLSSCLHVVLQSRLSAADVLLKRTEHICYLKSSIHFICLVLINRKSLVTLSTMSTPDLKNHTNKSTDVQIILMYV